MPFNHKEYDLKCSKRSKIELRRELEELESGIAAAGVTTGVLVLAIPVTMGLSAVGIGATGPAIYELRKRRAIVRKHLNAPGPEVGPNFSTQPTPLRSNRSGRDGSTSRSGSSDSSSSNPTSIRPKQSMEQLPEYTPAEGVLPHDNVDDRSKQVHVPIEEVDPPELPPSYDEATVKRTLTQLTSSTTVEVSGGSR